MAPTPRPPSTRPYPVASSPRGPRATSGNRAHTALAGSTKTALRTSTVWKGCDYRDLPPSPKADKIAAVGVIEHVGVARYPAFFARVRGWLRPGGLFLNHGITHTTTSPRTSGMAFLDRHVFPGGDLATPAHTIATMERAGLDVLHVEALGPHYVRTTKAWIERLEARQTTAVALVGETTYRTWLAYLAAAHVAFAARWIDVHQVLARRPA